MSDLLSILNRRKRSKEFTEGFREGATPEELEYYNQFYQEPTASPIMQRDELGRQLDETEAMRRALMARGMNTLQANDAVQRAKKQREAAFGHSKELYQQAHPDEGPGISDELSYSRYAEDYAPYTQTDDQGVETVMTGDPMSEQDFLNRQIARQRLAGDTSAAADARYKSETVDDRISMIDEQAKSLPGELQAKGISAEVTSKLMGEISRLLDEALKDPDNASVYADQAQELLRFVKASTGGGLGGGLNSYRGPQEHLNDDNIKEKINQSQATTQGGATVGQEGGQQLIAPRQTHIEGEYRP